jgi:hypothetical protein
MKNRQKSRLMKCAIFFASLLIPACAVCVPGVKAQARQRAKRPSQAERERDKRLKDEVKLGARLPFISDVRVIPSASNAVISFKSSQRTLPLVEIGRVPPAPDRFGVMAFPLGTSVFTRFVQPQDGRYTLNINATNEQLDAGTTYYYIINVFNDNQNDPTRKREQETGEISTFTQTVKVVWEKIYIVDDSDELSSGELIFWFWMNYGHPESKSFRMVNTSANSGQSIGFAANYEHVIRMRPMTFRCPLAPWTTTPAACPEYSVAAWRGEPESDRRLTGRLKTRIPSTTWRERVST